MSVKLVVAALLLVACGESVASTEPNYTDAGSPGTPAPVSKPAPAKVVETDAPPPAVSAVAAGQRGTDAAGAGAHRAAARVPVRRHARSRLVRDERRLRDVLCRFDDV